MTIQPLHSAAAATGGRRSLNREARKRELTKITRENQLILKRLQDKQASYNVSKWQKDEDHRVRILKNICEYPLASQDSLMQPDFIIKKKVKSSSTGAAFYNKKKGFSQPPTQMYGNQIVKKQTLYQGQHELGNGLYSIEMLIS